MSRKISWLLLTGVAIAAFLSIMVYSKQAVVDKGELSASAPQQPQNVNPSSIITQTPDPGPQKPICTLNREQAPDIDGMRLGMTVEQVLTTFPGSKEDSEIRSELARPPRLGKMTFTIRPEKYASKETFTGIQQVILGFLDGNLTDVNVGYRGLEWKHVDEFVTKFSQGKSLPPLDAWEAYVGLDNQLKTLRCDGFELSVFAGGKGVDVNYIQIKDLVADKELKERRAKAREKAPMEAKP